MTSRDFCYWLQGFFEITADPNPVLTVNQIITIKNHLAMVFLHEIDPSHGDKTHQDALSAAHQGGAAVEPSGFHRPPKARC